MDYTAKKAALAPMAGATDSAFRAVCMEQGASYCVSEMISAKALCMGDSETASLMARTKSETPFGIQLFGDDPRVMADAATIAAQNSPDFIDINMGCPAPKIVKSGAGSALLRAPDIAADIVRAVADACPLPVTVKLRSGWDESVVERIAAQLEQAGAKALTIHPRTREQFFSGRADYSVIKAVKLAVSIPVIGNGDVTCGADAARMLDETNCDGVMVGRGALGNPFVFAEIAAYLKGEEYIPPTPEQILATIRKQAELAIEQKGERTALLELRKHLAWYLKGFRGAAALRREAVSVETPEQLSILLEKVKAVI